MTKLYIIEKRDESGRLVFGRPQPEHLFGPRATTGISEDDMAKCIFRAIPDATLRGDNIAKWPALLDPQFIARRKAW